MTRLIRNKSKAEPAPPTTLFLFGAHGDLVKRLLMPALYNLSRDGLLGDCLLYTSPSPRDLSTSRMPSSA